MISRRFDRTREPTLQLSPRQQQRAEEVREKVETGEYAFETTDCPVCEDRAFEELAREDRYGLRHPTVICRDCGLIQVSPRMTAESFQTFYSTDYRELYNDGSDGLDAVYEAQRRKADRQYRYLVESHPSLEGASVLEVGTGPGGILSYFRDRGHEVRGCDLDRNAAAFARSAKDLDVRHGRVQDLDLDEAPDLIVLSHVVEHFTDPIEEFQAIRDISDSDTLLYVETPGIYHVPYSYKKDFKRLLQNAHTFYFSLDTLQNLMGQVGFDLVAGTEKIRSLFRPGADSARVENDYETATRFLSRLEYTRHLPTKSTVQGAFRNHVAPAAADVLKKAGLHDDVQALFQAITRRRRPA